ncbi:MAG: hypothetical protein ACRECW_14235 [Phyllobacterium sp.]
MPGLLHPLHEGHAPIVLHHAFQDAIDAFEDWQAGSPEPVINVYGKDVLISAVFRRMWKCTDILPARIASAVHDLTLPGQTEASTANSSVYADAAQILWELCARKRSASLIERKRAALA